MLQKINKTRNFLLYRSFTLIILLLFIMINTACSSTYNLKSGLISPETNSATSLTSQDTSTQDTQNDNNALSGQLKVHFIDVGQADCILIQNNNAAMLIDAGNNADAPLILDYLNKLNIEELDYVIGTHPHEDHIGSLDKVIDSFSIGKVYMPKVTTTTRAFEDAVMSIKNKGLKITTPVAGTEFSFGESTCKILAPVSSSYEDLNNYSIVIKLTFGSTSFLFTGDAEDVSESEMLGKKFDLKADVLKVGHHGSTSSASASFLKAVSPKYAVISAGKDNDYGHPSQKILDRLSADNIQVYRTDEKGTIVATSDGNTIKFDKSTSAIKPQAPPVKVNETISTTASKATSKSVPIASETISENVSETDQAFSDTVYITKTGSKYHADGCRYLSKSKIPTTLNEAKNSGYSACSVCHPPK